MPSVDSSRPRLPLTTILGLLCLCWGASVYSGYGLSTYPEQHWLIEGLASLLFIAPVVNLLRGPGELAAAVRFLGAALVAHAGWDALHWESGIQIQTPIAAWIPRFTFWTDLALGLILVARGR